jgi:hypothetical protein
MTQTDGNGEFATIVIEARDNDLDGLAFVTSVGPTIRGRIVREGSATDIDTPLGMRVNASPGPDAYSKPSILTAKVHDDWTFELRGVADRTQFTVAQDRMPAVTVTHFTLDDVDSPGSSAVEVSDGEHELVLYVRQREVAKPTGSNLTLTALVEQFKQEEVFWRQFAIAKEIVARRDAGALALLTDWLDHVDRHVRGNAAFIFAALGDPRGFEVITKILDDRSDRPQRQGIGIVSSDGRYHLGPQIRADRYYAAHLLGDLRDPRAVAILIPLLKDPDVESIVPWSLGQIGDKRAIPPLIDLLDENSPTTRVLAIYALETLNAREAVPRLTALLDDDRRSNFGSQVSVSEAAKAAIAKLY